MLNIHWNKYSFPHYIHEEISANFSKKIVDFQITFLVAISLVFIRIFLQRYIFSPLGRYYGLKEFAPVKANSQIPKKPSSFPDKKITKVDNIAKKVGWNETQADKSLKKRTYQKKSRKMIKFVESGGRFTFYFTMHIYGVITLSSKSWLFDLNEYWRNYPYQTVPNDIRWYYIIEMGFYISAIFYHIKETKYTDFIMMLSHHISTVLILSISWLTMFFRIGSVVLLLFDISDIFLEFAKLLKYIGKQKVANAFFICFAASWFIFRIGVFPVRILYPAVVGSDKFIPKILTYWGYQIQIGLLFVLFLFNIVWALMILRAIEQFLRSSTFEASDIRSDSEGSDSGCDSEGESEKFESSQNRSKQD